MFYKLGTLYHTLLLLILKKINIYEEHLTTCLTTQKSYQKKAFIVYDYGWLVLFNEFRN